MFQSGFISIVGRPNVGKSTLFNAIIGEKLSIIADKPQTTRNKITGVKNLSDAQLIFLDTPGIHKAKTPLNRAMVQTAQDTLGDADVLLMIVDAAAGVHQQDVFLITSLKEINAPVFLVINKTDLIEKNLLLPLIDKFSKMYNFREIFLVSALKNQGLVELLQAIKAVLPEGPRYFAEDEFTDASERFIASEFIREKIMRCTSQEIPYVTAVEVEAFKENEEKNITHITASIIVEKESQKAIVIGKKGAMLKNIGTQARLEMERLFGTKIFLELFVRVKKDWTSSDKMLKEFGLIKK